MKILLALALLLLPGRRAPAQGSGDANYGPAIIAAIADAEAAGRPSPPDASALGLATGRYETAIQAMYRELEARREAVDRAPEGPARAEANRSYDEYKSAINKLNEQASAVGLHPPEVPAGPATVEPVDAPPEFDEDDAPGGHHPPPAHNDPALATARGTVADATAQGLALREQRAPGSVRPADYTDAARRSLQADKPDQALSLLNRAVERSPKDASALSLRARTRTGLGDREGGLEDARRALAVQPGNKMAGLIVGQADALGRMKGGVRPDFGAGGDPGALAGGAGPAVGYGRGRPAASAPSARRPGPAPGPSAPAVLDLIRNAERRLLYKDHRGALLDLSQAIAAEPANAKALTLRAQLSNQLKNHAGALQDAEAALAAEPQSVPALLAKANAELGLGRHEEALRTAEAALALDPRSPLGRLYRAMALEKLGRGEEALREYELAARFDAALQPFYDEAKASLGAPAAQARPALSRATVRGAALALALLLIALGLFGTEAGRRVTTKARSTVFGRAAAPPPPPSARLGTLAAGTVIGENFRVVRELGRGGMGVVYEAEDAVLQRKVAIKQLQRDEHTTGADFQRFLAEARLVAKLRHPNLAEIHSIVEDGDLFLVFDFVEGRTLDAALSERGFFRPEDARKLLAEICSALDCAHAQKIIHRDLKPANVMIATDGTSRVMDFGIAHQARSGAELTRTSGAGTPPYMAPEQAMGAVSKASDLYALAVMAYELLAGRRPFDGPDYLTPKMHAEFPPVTRARAGLPRGFDVFFEKALAADPSKRYQTASEFLAGFDAASRT